MSAGDGNVDGEECDAAAGIHCADEVDLRRLAELLELDEEGDGNDVDEVGAKRALVREFGVVHADDGEAGLELVVVR